jgi:hypothetical protein
MIGKKWFEIMIKYDYTLEIGDKNTQLYPEKSSINCI